MARWSTPGRTPIRAGWRRSWPRTSRTGRSCAGANIERITTATADATVYLEDEAGNANPATAVGAPRNATPITLEPPILQPSVRSDSTNAQAVKAAKLKITSAKRSGNRLTIKGTIARELTAKVTATLARGKRKASTSTNPSGGRFTIRLTIPKPLRAKGTNTLTLRFSGQGDFGAASVSKRLTTR